MSEIDPQILSDRAAAVRRHLRRVENALPASAGDFLPDTSSSDTVILHLWQAVQIVLDLAMMACVRLDLGTPGSYSDAFGRLARAGLLDPALGIRLGKAAGFRNLVAHAYESLDMARVYQAAKLGPLDLMAFLAAMARRASLPS